MYSSSTLCKCFSLSYDPDTLGVVFRLLFHKLDLSKQSNAPYGADSQRMFTVIHPFHPLYGQKFSLVTFRQNWAVDKVYYHDDQGQLKSLPSSYTDILPTDPFIVLSGQKSIFHPQHILALLRIMESLQQHREEQND